MLQEAEKLIETPNTNLDGFQLLTLIRELKNRLYDAPTHFWKDYLQMSLQGMILSLLKNKLMMILKISKRRLGA